MLREATLRDFLLAIGVSGGLAVVYFMTLRRPDRNAATRLIDRWTDVWSEAAWEPPKRLQLWVVAIVSTVIALGTLVAFFVTVVKGSLR